MAKLSFPFQKTNKTSLKASDGRTRRHPLAILAGGLVAFFVAGPALAAPDFSGTKAIDTVLFYPGQTSIEWVLKGSDHGGARAFKKGERCAECHRGEEKDMGAKIVSGEKAESSPIPDKPAFIDAKIKAKHDGSKLYVQIAFPESKHVPVPFADGGKMDPANQVKVTMMIAGDGVKLADRSGCWVACHHDSRYMPDAPDKAALGAVSGIDTSDGVTKYLKESRTKLEVRGRGGKPRGGWDKLKDAGAIKDELDGGHFMDLVRYNSGADGKAENGHILEQRNMTDSGGVSGTGVLKDGTWTVTLVRDLAAGGAGDIAIEAGKQYSVNFAIHDDYADARFHHVSFEYTMGLDDAAAELNVTK